MTTFKDLKDDILGKKLVMTKEQAEVMLDILCCKINDPDSEVDLAEVDAGDDMLLPAPLAVSHLEVRIEEMDCDDKLVMEITDPMFLEVVEETVMVLLNDH